MSEYSEVIKRLKDVSFRYFGLLCTLFGLAMLIIFIGGILDEGLGRINWDFIKGPAPVITLSLQMRFASRDEENFTARMLAALRNQFGGHAIKKAE